MKISRIAYCGLVIIALLLALCATSCRATRQIAEPGTPSIAARAIARDSTGAFSPRIATPATFAGFTDAIGLSTAEGRARRQARKDAAATVPRHLGKGSVYAPLASEVFNTYKPRQAVIRADSGAVVQNTGGGAAAAGAGATATGGATIAEAPGLLATLGKPLGYVLAAVGVGVAGYLLYLIWAFLPRRNNEQA